MLWNKNFSLLIAANILLFIGVYMLFPLFFQWMVKEWGCTVSQASIQAGREVRVMVVPDQISDSDMVLLARDISKKIEAEMEYPGQIKVNVIRESRVTDYAK